MDTHLLKLCVLLGRVGVIKAHDQRPLENVTVIGIEESSLGVADVQVAGRQKHTRVWVMFTIKQRTTGKEGPGMMGAQCELSVSAFLHAFIFHVHMKRPLFLHYFHYRTQY